MRKALICVAVMAGAAPASAQTFQKECDPDDPKKCSQPLQRGQKAEFSGQLLTPRMAIDLGQKANDCDVSTEMEVERVEQKLTIDLNAAIQKATIQKQSDADRIQLLMDRLKEAKKLQEVPFWERPAFVVPVTVVLTLGAVYGAVEMVKATK